MNDCAGTIRPTTTVRLVAMIPLLALLATPLCAECPPGESNPITSGSEAAGPPVVFSMPALDGAAFFTLSESGPDGPVAVCWDCHSASLPARAWLTDLGDLEETGRKYFRIDAPGEGPGGWGDPRTSGCPSMGEWPHPPLAIVLYRAHGDFDKDGTWDVFEDANRNGALDAGEDLDGDGYLTWSGRDCEGFLREDQDCDGRLDTVNEDLNGNDALDPGEDRDGDHHLDHGTEDRNRNGVLDDRGRAFFYLLQYHDAQGGSGYGAVSAGLPREASP